MNRTIDRVVGLMALVAAVAWTGSAWGAPGDVRTSFDAPCDYPAGMATDGQHLFIARSRPLTGASSVRGTLRRSNRTG